MPHPESEHGLRVQLATALRERDEALALANQNAFVGARHKDRADTAEANALAVAQQRIEERASRERNWDEMKESLAAANARADVSDAALRRAATEMARLEGALAAARRESTLYRGVIDNLLSVMEMQEKRESGAFHITGEVMFGIWSDAKSQARAALATGGEGK